jgi:L-aspartate oxidase
MTESMVCRAVRTVCSEGPERVLELVDMGASFTRSKNGKLHLTKEGGHSARRIVHAADTTGAEISRTLVEAVKAHPRIQTFENHMCLALCTSKIGGVSHCFGADVLDVQSGAIVRFTASATMLASGGAGQLYPATTNPSVATGDGIAVSYLAGADIANVEFVQFHPTALYDPHASGRTFLISEAVRGEGGQLFNLHGHRFMSDYDSRLELAPRDVVARAIQDQMTKHGHEHVWLDISHVDSTAVLEHFPAISKKCRELGIDITKDPIPVLPAQHYLCGGVQTNLSGETSIAGLFACGEVSHTGLHGANRLASNSLLEGLVFGARAVDSSVAHATKVQRELSKELAAAAQTSAVYYGAEMSWRAREWAERLRVSLKELMWKCAGIKRTGDGLSHGLQQLSGIEVEVRALASIHRPCREIAELQNLVTCANLVLSSALMRQESRGLHFREDFPQESAELLSPTILRATTKDAVEPVAPAVLKRVQEQAVKVSRLNIAMSV